MGKSPDAFRTISEVAEWLGIQAHVLRFWESKFAQVKPVKRAGGRRYYRPADMALLGGIKKLLHEDGLTIKGVQKILREQGAGFVSAQSAALDDMPAEAPPRTPKVVSFQSRMSFQPDQPESDPADAGGPELPESATIPRSEPDLVEGDALPEAALPDPDDIDLGGASEPSPEAIPDPADSEPAAAAPTPEPPALPSFLHRPTEPDAAAPTVAPKPTPTPAQSAVQTAAQMPAAPRPRIIEAPDPPAERDIRYVPGVLGVLAGIDRLDAEQARALAPVAKDLRAALAHLTGSDSA